MRFRVNDLVVLRVAGPLKGEESMAGRWAQVVEVNSDGENIAVRFKSPPGERVAPVVWFVADDAEKFRRGG